jgi:hypothetical protein
MHLRAGFRAVLRQPSVALAEIAWRWAFGAGAWTLVFFALRRILAHVDITQVELLIARRSNVLPIAEAGARILVQVLPQLASECLVLAPAIAILWIAAGTVGRALTLRALLSREAGEPGEEASSNPPIPTLFRQNWAEEGWATRPRFGSLLLLNCLRALFTFVAIIAFLGAFLFAGAAFPSRNPAVAVLIGFFLASLVGFFWSVVNWFLALAPIWIVRGRPLLKSIADSLDLYRRSRSSYLGIASAFGVFRGAALVAGIIAGLVASQASPAAAVALSVVIALLYFAAADFLYIARLAAYIALDESSQPAPVRSQPISPEPQPLSSPGI